MVSTVKERKYYIVINLTQNEQIILEMTRMYCQADYAADVDLLANASGMSVYSVKGVIGSLVKKDRVVCEQEERADRLFYDIFYKGEDGKILSYGDWS